MNAQNTKNGYLLTSINDLLPLSTILLEIRSYENTRLFRASIEFLEIDVHMKYTFMKV